MNVRFTPEVFEQINVLAKAQGISPAAYIAKAMASHVGAA